MHSKCQFILIYRTKFLEMAMAAKTQKGAISPYKAQPKFGTRFDNPEISVKIGFKIGFMDLLNFTQNRDFRYFARA